jgi:hypothetical protein
LRKRDTQIEKERYIENQFAKSGEGESNAYKERDIRSSQKKRKKEIYVGSIGLIGLYWAVGPSGGD